jgi:hypothetical protein
MLNLSMRSLLQQLAQQIEEGETPALDGLHQANAEARWEANLTDDQRQGPAQWRQSEATRPAVDPKAAAQNYVQGE